MTLSVAHYIFDCINIFQIQNEFRFQPVQFTFLAGHSSRFLMVALWNLLLLLHRL